MSEDVEDQVPLLERYTRGLFRPCDLYHLYFHVHSLEKWMGLHTCVICSPHTLFIPNCTAGTALASQKVRKCLVLTLLPLDCGKAHKFQERGRVGPVGRWREVLSTVAIYQPISRYFYILTMIINLSTCFSPSPQVTTVPLGPESLWHSWCLHVWHLMHWFSLFSYFLNVPWHVRCYSVIYTRCHFDFFTQSYLII